MIRTATSVVALFGVVVTITLLDGVPLLILALGLAAIGIGAVVVESRHVRQPVRRRDV